MVETITQNAAKKLIARVSTSTLELNIKDTSPNL